MKNAELDNAPVSSFCIFHSAFVPLFQFVTAVNDAGVEEGRLTTLAPALSRPTGEGVFGGARLRRAVTGFRLKGLSPHPKSWPLISLPCGECAPEIWQRQFPSRLRFDATSRVRAGD